MTDDDLRAWAAIDGTRGVGPRAIYRIAVGLRQAGLRAGDLLDLDRSSLVDRLISFGASSSTATGLADTLASGGTVPSRPDGTEIIHPDRSEYPLERLDPRRPLPALLYAMGATALLDQAGVAIVGSREVGPTDVGLAGEVATALAGKGLNIVSGHARGVDHAAHAGAIAGGGTTTAVLAEGIRAFQPRDGVIGDRHSTLIVSQFPPDARWRGHQAMARNATVAALVQAVVVVRSGDSGGTWEMIKHCTRVGLPVVAAVGAVPEDVPAEVNVVPADASAMVDAVVDALQTSELSLF